MPRKITSHHSCRKIIDTRVKRYKEQGDQENTEAKRDNEKEGYKGWNDTKDKKDTRCTIWLQYKEGMSEQEGDYYYIYCRF